MPSLYRGRGSEICKDCARGAGDATLMYGYTQFSLCTAMLKRRRAAYDGPGSRSLFMQTEGRLRQVFTFRMTEQFNRQFPHSVLGMDVGETVAQVRASPVVGQ